MKSSEADAYHFVLPQSIVLQNLCYNCQFLCWCGNQNLCDKISKASFCVCKNIQKQALLYPCLHKF